MLSIIVPVYNASRYLSDCVNSLLSQTYKDIEIILVNDGSKDDSPQICDYFASEYSNVHVIHKRNGGVHSARNTGFDNCNGDYVAFVDADDLLDPQAYEIMMKSLISNNADVVACGYKTEYGDIHIKTDYSLTYNSKVFNGTGNCLDGISKGLQGFVWNKIIRKDIIGNLRFRGDIPICDDLFFCYELMLKTNKAVCIDVPFYHYRYVAVSFSKKAPISRYMGCLEGLNRLNDWAEIYAPQCVPAIRGNFIFWNTKACEQMIDDFHSVEFEHIQKYISENEEYITGCSRRIRLLARSILKSWKTYRFYGLFFYRLKKIYIFFHK